MVQSACSEQEFINTFQRLQSTNLVAKHLGIATASVRKRKARIANAGGPILPVADTRPAYNTSKIQPKGRIAVTLPDGVIVVFADAHYLPGEPTTAQRGLVAVLKKLKPAIVVCNGDAADFATISRFPRIGWDEHPTVKQEMEVIAERLGEIEAVSNQAKLYWPLGNHDARFEVRLVAVAPEFEGVKGLTLKESFPRWTPCWSLAVNGNTMIKHRWAVGVHKDYNNTLRSGWSFVAAHAHSLKVTPWSDLNGARYGVDCGTLADTYGPQFQDYCEDAPRNWRAGFAILTYVGGKLMPPETVEVVDDGKMFFRGQVIRV